MLGHGGIARVSEATGLSPHTIRAGLRALRGLEEGNVAALDPDRVRQPGAGRKSRVVESPTLLGDLEALIEPVCHGDTTSPLRWTCEGTVGLAALLRDRGHTVSPRLVAGLLQKLGYTFLVKQRPAGGRHADRGSQFAFVNDTVDTFHRRGQPVVAVTTRHVAAPLEAAPAHQRSRVATAGPPPPQAGGDPTGEVATAGEQAGPSAWRTIPTTPDAASFVAVLLRHWWGAFGREGFPEARDLLVVTDVAGSRRVTHLAWQLALQSVADEMGLNISVCYLPPGTSRWTRIVRTLTGLLEVEVGDERQRQSIEVRVIGSLRSSAGMVLLPDFEHERPPAAHDRTPSPASLIATPASVFGDWNYTIHPHPDRDVAPSVPQTAS